MSAKPKSEIAGPARGVASGDWFGDSERNWPEDFASENGNYGHVCRDCGHTFVGHKRRPSLCRKCARELQAAWDASTPEEKQKAMEKLKRDLACLMAPSPNAEISHAEKKT